jgi:methionyl-tRNA formyltransferase
MQVVFGGTPEFARTVLDVLVQDGRHEVAAVMCQPDKPVGRHRHKVEPPPVKAYAIEQGLDVFQPEKLSDPSVREWLAGVGVEAVVVAAYGKLIPGELLAVPPRGFINVHASLLPSWRGAAPIQRSILAGEHRTGTCVMQMDEGMDTGPVWACAGLDVLEDETAGELAARLAERGGRLLTETLEAIEQGVLATPVPQSEDKATIANKVGPEDVRLDFKMPVEGLIRRVRAGNPKPGAAVATEQGPLKVWRARRVETLGTGAKPPGTVLAMDPELVVTAADDGLALLEVQPPGKGRMSGDDFARGRRLALGDVLA